MKGRLQGGGTRSASLPRWFGSVRKRGEIGRKRVRERIGRQRDTGKEKEGERQEEN